MRARPCNILPTLNTGQRSMRSGAKLRVMRCPVEGWAWLAGWTLDVESTLDFTGFRLDSGVQGIHPGVHQTSDCYCVVICAFWGGLHAGWLPKKIALTLAMRRASPPSIRFRPERNRKTMA
jgi:hypothetical protein